jgi:hypothetical protein
VKSRARPLTLPEAVRVLRRHHGPPQPPPTADPFELVLWENVAYLASPERRREAFAALRREVGTTPARILAAADEALESIAARGILPKAFAGKLRACAQIALEHHGGDPGKSDPRSRGVGPAGASDVSGDRRAGG